MRKNRVLSLLLSLVLLLALALNLTGCAHSIAATDLMAGIVPRTQSDVPETVPDASCAAAADFAVRLFRQTYDGNNTLLSPLSVLTALAMTANGARGETRAQMERVFGMTIEELNAFFTIYLNLLRSDENGKLSLANAIWLRDVEGFTVKADFLQTNADVYGAGAYRAKFDATTVKDVNRWVKDHTDGMIDEIIDRLYPDDLAVLVNALAFDAKWEKPYEKNSQRSSGVFHREDGVDVNVTFLSNTESLYLSDGDRAVGFIKPYEGGRYAFAALLPDKGIPLPDYLASLDGEKITALLKNAKRLSVETKLPKFETKYGVNLNTVLPEMGMTDAFSAGSADFTGITETPFYIGDVLHKTYIEVGEQGTRAGAVTVVKGKSASASADEVPSVILDRPFVYLLFDTETNIPFFIGVLNDPMG